MRSACADQTTVLIRSDGRAVACGDNFDGQCNIPPLDEGVSYTRFLQVLPTWCFSEVMGELLLAEAMPKDNATFHL